MTRQPFRYSKTPAALTTPAAGVRWLRNYCTTMNYRAALLIVTVLVSSYSVSPAHAVELMCKELTSFANSVTGEDSKSITLVRGGKWLIDHYKSCRYSDDDEPSVKFCAWLMKYSSTEFMEANINSVISCLQGQTIEGGIANTGIESWAGSIRFYSPRIDVDDVIVEVEYSVKYSVDSGSEDFIEITVESN